MILLDTNVLTRITRSRGNSNLHGILSGDTLPIGAGAYQEDDH